MTRKLDCSEQALIEAKKLVAYIEFFRTHGTGDVLRRYPDDDHMGGYDNIVRRARECAESINRFDGRAHFRAAASLNPNKAA
jgi:hypothetical protein